MRGAVGGVRHSSIPVPAVGLAACIPKTEVGAQGAKTHRHSISAAAAYQDGMKGRLPLTSIKIKSKVFRFKHLLHTWAQRFRWSKQLSEHPKSSLLISGRLFKHYELQGRETGSVASVSCARIDPRLVSPNPDEPPRRREEKQAFFFLSFLFSFFSAVYYYSVVSLSCARIDPRSGPPQHKPPRRPELCAGM